MRAKIVGVLFAILMLVGVVGAEGNSTAIGDSPAVIQNLVGLGVWAVIGLSLLFGTVAVATHVLSQYFSYKVLDKGISTIVNLKTLQEVDRALDENSNQNQK